MPKFHARQSEDGASVTYWNMESISHAKYVERTETLKITLIDGFTFELRGQEATDVIEFISKNQFEPYRDPTPEDIASFKEFAKSLFGRELS
jgi:hypothetical protein